MAGPFLAGIPAAYDLEIKFTTPTKTAATLASVSPQRVQGQHPYLAVGCQTGALVGPWYYRPKENLTKPSISTHGLMRQPPNQDVKERLRLCEDMANRKLGSNHDDTRPKLYPDLMFGKERSGRSTLKVHKYSSREATWNWGGKNFPGSLNPGPGAYDPSDKNCGKFDSDPSYSMVRDVNVKNISLFSKKKKIVRERPHSAPMKKATKTSDNPDNSDESEEEEEVVFRFPPYDTDVPGAGHYSPNFNWNKPKSRNAHFDPPERPSCPPPEKPPIEKIFATIPYSAPQHVREAMATAQEKRRKRQEEEKKRKSFKGMSRRVSLLSHLQGEREEDEFTKAEKHRRAQADVMKAQLEEDMMIAKQAVKGKRSMRGVGRTIGKTMSSAKRIHQVHSKIADKMSKSSQYHQKNEIPGLDLVNSIRCIPYTRQLTKIREDQAPFKLDAFRVKQLLNWARGMRGKSFPERKHTIQELISFAARAIEAETRADFEVSGTDVSPAESIYWRNEEIEAEVPEPDPANLSKLEMIQSVLATVEVEKSVQDLNAEGLIAKRRLELEKDAFRTQRKKEEEKLYLYPDSEESEVEYSDNEEDKQGGVPTSLGRRKIDFGAMEAVVFGKSAWDAMTVSTKVDADSTDASRARYIRKQSAIANELLGEMNKDDDAEGFARENMLGSESKMEKMLSRRRTSVKVPMHPGLDDDEGAGRGDEAQNAAKMEKMLGRRRTSVNIPPPMMENSEDEPSGERDAETNASRMEKMLGRRRTSVSIAPPPDMMGTQEGDDEDSSEEAKAKMMQKMLGRRRTSVKLPNPMEMVGEDGNNGGNEESSPQSKMEKMLGRRRTSVNVPFPSGLMGPPVEETMGSAVSAGTVGTIQESANDDASTTSGNDHSSAIDSTNNNTSIEMYGLEPLF